MYSLNNYINTYRRDIKSIKSGTHKNNLKSNLVYLGNKRINKKKQKGYVSSKSIE